MALSLLPQPAGKRGNHHGVKREIDLGPAAVAPAHRPPASTIGSDQCWLPLS
jgi:hypothetical protein